MKAGQSASGGALLLVGAAGTCALWLVSTFFFVLDAWGSRGMEKPWFFDLWATATWVVGPLLIGALAFAGVLLLAYAVSTSSR